MQAKHIVLLVCFLSVSHTLVGQQATENIPESRDLSFGIIPHLTIPIGQYADNYDIGGGAAVAIRYSPASFVAISGNIGYTANPHTTGYLLSKFSGSLSLALGIGLGESIRLQATAGGGFYYGLLGTWKRQVVLTTFRKIILTTRGEKRIYSFCRSLIRYESPWRENTCA